MKRIKFKLLIATLISFAVILSSCKESCPCEDSTNPECDNYDPCFGKREINTQFIMNNGYNGWAPPPDWCIERMVYSDTFSTTRVRFFVREGNETSTYEWRIGTDDRVRTEDEFELSFEEYIETNGWNISIPISLTIRTPLNDCLNDLSDTLVEFTRNLYFTDEQVIGGFTGIWDEKEVYQGIFTSELEKVVQLEFYGSDPDNDTFNFPGRPGRYELIIGLPIADTVLVPDYSNCGYSEGCGNRVYRYRRWFRQEVCPELDLTRGFNSFEAISDYETNTVNLKFSSDLSGKEWSYEFNGKRIN